ncbi:unnamed protein product [Microthlaspi erraticum]|uniref:MATH domain-containing protein n=1 Tax=Microthlaspi erraticum TaxID=1685480 RepID=A0A6D2L8I1_9BRAS|nr:unnamed protein product [Microthlaspi erraticum]
MSETTNEDSGAGRSADGSSNGQRSQSEEALAESYSSDQVESCTPLTTSSPNWGIDDDDDIGPKPSELFGRHTWKIEKFSEINDEQELRSDVFEVGGYHWYILIFPKGCDNNLSVLLCAANYDNLRPGWNHFAQFTVALVNTADPKKSKHRDKLHRFCNRMRIWGWPEFIELPKLQDGYLDDSGSLLITSQVQVISFSDFWLGLDQNFKREMSRERRDVIHEQLVTIFFDENEVTSTLLMDAFYSGLKSLALEGQTKTRPRVTDTEDLPAPMVRMDGDMFVLVDDFVLLLERAALEPSLPEDDKGSQTPTKDENARYAVDNEATEREERRLTELGRFAVERFVLGHLFINKIERPYQEAVAWTRQEDLIREEEEALLVERERKAKRGAAEKEKKSKKKKKKNKGKAKKKEESVRTQAEESFTEKDEFDPKNQCPSLEQPIPETNDVVPKRKAVPSSSSSGDIQLQIVVSEADIKKTPSPKPETKDVVPERKAVPPSSSSGDIQLQTAVSEADIKKTPSPKPETKDVVPERKAVPSSSSSGDIQLQTVVSEADIKKTASPKPAAQPVQSMSRPVTVSAPIISRKQTSPIVSAVQTSTLSFSRSMRSTCHIGSPPHNQTYIPQSYQHAMVSSSGIYNSSSQPTVTSKLPPYSHPLPVSVSNQSALPINFGSWDEVSSGGLLWTCGSSSNKDTTTTAISGNHGTNPCNTRIISDQFGRTAHSLVTDDEYPHIGIINDLLEDE